MYKWDMNTLPNDENALPQQQQIPNFPTVHIIAAIVACINWGILNIWILGWWKSHEKVVKIMGLMIWTTLLFLFVYMHLNFRILSLEKLPKIKPNNMVVKLLGSTYKNVNLHQIDYFTCWLLILVSLKTHNPIFLNGHWAWLNRRST